MFGDGTSSGGWKNTLLLPAILVHYYPPSPYPILITLSSPPSSPSSSPLSSFSSSPSSLGSTTTELANGTIVELRVGGTKLQTNPDGATIETCADGSTIQESPDGTKVTILADGTRTQRNADGVVRLPAHRSVCVCGCVWVCGCGWVVCVRFGSMSYLLTPHSSVACPFSPHSNHCILITATDPLS